MTPVRRNRRKQTRPRQRSQPQPALSAEPPIDAAVIQRDPGNVLAKALVEDWLPGDEGKAEVTVGTQDFEHGKAAAGEIGRTDESAGDVFTCLHRLEGSSKGGRHL